jgi:nucleoside-diphosphate-sugar epimerase
MAEALNGAVGVIGASSFVGAHVLAILAREGVRTIAWSRRSGPSPSTCQWAVYGEDIVAGPIRTWLCMAPIWSLPEHFDLIARCGGSRIVALSSTSRYTKLASRHSDDATLARRLIDGETVLRDWAAAHNATWTVLRPTLIYGDGRDKNIAEIARFIRRFGFFPLFGRASGMRQPIHVADVAHAVCAAALAPAAEGAAYNISGGETLTYRAMVERVFARCGRRAIAPSIPMPVFQAAVGVVRVIPRYRHWSAAMAERMNIDMAFDHSAAATDFGFAPRPFDLMDGDLPAL